jgi:CDP-diacylglycerol--glycerol-3-phosphate 3-phosphatidyltransferase
MPHANSLWGVPNLLSLSRLPLAAVLFACITWAVWPAALAVLLVAVLTDWLDGWWARRYGQQSALGRALDPLTDKVLVAGAFIFLIPVPAAGIAPWMATVVIAREILITGLRGMVESSGRSFGADWFGKLKTVLQFAVLIGVLLLEAVRDRGLDPAVVSALGWAQLVLLYGMLAATVGSGLQYLAKAARLMR